MSATPAPRLACDPGPVTSLQASLDCSGYAAAGHLQVSISAVTGSGYSGSSSPDPVPALQGVIRRDEEDLQDWLTCVSASTPKGKAQIQSLSAQISAARAAINRAQQTQVTTHGASPDSLLTYSAAGAAGQAGTGAQQRSLDVWA